MLNLLHRDPRDYVISLLALISAVSLLASPSLSSLVHLLTAVSLAAALDVILKALTRRQLIFPRSGLVTGLLIGLILDPTVPLWLTGLACLTAIASKLVFKLNQQHVFNPAAFGLLIAGLLWPASVSWWAVSPYPLTSLILLVDMAALLVFRLPIWPLPVGFLLVYFTYTLMKFPFSLFRFIDPTIFLFAWVMVSEYKTSPVTGSWRYTFGALVGIIFLVLIELWPNLPTDPLITALLTGNLFSFSLRHLPAGFRTNLPPPPASSPSAPSTTAST